MGGIAKGTAKGGRARMQELQTKCELGVGRLNTVRLRLDCPYPCLSGASNTLTGHASLQARHGMINGERQWCEERGE